MADVLMTRMSDSMEEGTIVTWHKTEGEIVACGDPLVEIETDKWTVTYESDQAGSLSIVCGAGATVAVGGLIATITATDASQPQPATAIAAPSAPAASGAPTVTGRGEVTYEQLSRGQQTVARKMAEAKATVPDFALEIEVKMDACVELRQRLAETAAEGAHTPTYNDMIVRACGLALRATPRVNGAYRDGCFELYQRVNIGVAVSGLDTLIVATVFDADLKTLDQIAVETKSLASRVRSATITPPELSGQTFTVSNLGMYGITRFGAVINAPQAAILSVGSIREAVVVVDGAAAVGQRMTLTLGCDHRILYGADGAAFLTTVRDLLEVPSTLT